MRINENTILLGKDVFLVPYRSEHVDRYHAWMSDPALQELTASAPLTIDEEYAMQKSWHLDEDKLTFIVLSRNGEEERPESLTSTMIGDVNLFLSPLDLDNDDSTARPDTVVQGELEIMIAESSARRRGCATQAISLMIRYALAQGLVKEPKHFIVRIGEQNTQSIAMFQKLGFEIVKRVAVFEEVELRIREAPASARWEQEATTPMSMLQC